MGEQGEGEIVDEVRSNAFARIAACALAGHSSVEKRIVTSVTQRVCQNC